MSCEEKLVKTTELIKRIVDTFGKETIAQTLGYNEEIVDGQLFAYWNLVPSCQDVHYLFEVRGNPFLFKFVYKPFHNELCGKAVVVDTRLLEGDRKVYVTCFASRAYEETEWVRLPKQTYELLRELVMLSLKREEKDTCVQASGELSRTLVSIKQKLDKVESVLIQRGESKSRREK